MAVVSPAGPAVVRADEVKRLLEKAIALWSEGRGDLDRFMVWLRELCESL
ncbi:hypothetical protein [Synechococcus sp. CCY 9618]|nr:hypothetical protein [Synechococcus sp. CCY 9618]